MESRWDSGWPRAGGAGTPPRPGWFFLDKIFGGRKVQFVKRKTAIEMAHLTEGLTGGGSELYNWFRDASIPELHEYVLNVSTTRNPHAYQIATTTLDIRIAEEQSESATKLEKQTDRLVTQTNALVSLTRKLYLLTVALIIVAVIQTIVMLCQK